MEVPSGIGAGCKQEGSDVGVLPLGPCLLSCASFIQVTGQCPCQGGFGGSHAPSVRMVTGVTQSRSAEVREALTGSSTGCEAALRVV